jgi:hypothetical protein
MDRINRINRIKPNAKPMPGMYFEVEAKPNP